MGPSRQTRQLLHDEHRANLDLLGRVEQVLARLSRRDPQRLAPLTALARHLAHDVARHFDFEERELFPRMSEAGDADIAALLTEEHQTIREVAAELLPLAQNAAALDEDGWRQLERLALELVERQVSHIQKEEMALLPLLDDLLDDETDRELSFGYSSQ